MAGPTAEELQAQILQQRIIEARRVRNAGLDTQAREGFQSGVAGVVGLPNTIIGATREALAAPTTGRRGAGAGQPQNVPQTPTQPGLLERHTLTPQEAYQGMSQVTGLKNTPPQTPLQRMVRSTSEGLGSGVVGGGAGMVGGAVSGAASQGAAELGAPPAVQGIAGLAAAAATGGLIRPKNVAPSLETLQQDAHTAYQAADNAGVVISQPKMLQIATDMTNSVLKAGIDKTIHPGAVATLMRVIDDAKKAPGLSLSQLDITRRIIGGVAKSNQPDERRIAKLMLNHLDEQIAGLKPTDVLAGDSKVATEALKSARDLWGRFRKAQLIENVLDKAKRQAARTPGGNLETSIKSGIDGILNNPNKLRGFTAVERGLMRKLVDTGGLHDFLTWVGTFSPEGNSLRGTAAMATGSIGAYFDPRALALPAAGLIARRVSSSITGANVNKLSQTVRSGILPTLSSAQNRKLERLLSGGMTAGAVRQGNQ